jgi:hypothetical protein
MLSRHGHPHLQVSCRDSQGVEHTVEVTAQNVFEAVAQALRVFREYEWCDLALGASVRVRIRQPEVEHRVQIRDFYNWLEAAGRSPAEMTLKSVCAISSLSNSNNFGERQLSTDKTQTVERFSTA